MAGTFPFRRPLVLTLGSGGFLVIKPSTTHKNPNPLCREPISIDFRETAPGSAYAHMFSPRPLDPSFDPARASRVGGLSIGVPGEIRGLEAAYKACGGGVSWARLFQPAANIARKSPLGPELARRLRIDYFSGWMMEDPLWKKIFAPNGTFLNTGEVLRRETYAVTLETIGREGADAFYSVRSNAPRRCRSLIIRRARLQMRWSLRSSTRVGI